MEPASDQFEDAASAYRHLVQQESQEAAATIGRIHAAFGARAALRAALIITILKVEVQQNHWIPGIGLYVHLLEDFPEVLPLAKHAMACCLQVWATTIFEPGGWAELTAA